jgi:signal transduction histidine kinase
VDLNGLLEHLLELLQATLHEQHIKVRTEFEKRLPRLWGKPDELQRALLNLVLNAIEAMPSGGTLMLRTCSDEAGMQAGQQQERPPPHPAGADYGSSITVEIADTGMGMKTEVQARIFDPFFTTRPGSGGIGLTVSKKIITEHGGQIHVQSTPGRGSVFTLTLPFSSEANKHMEQDGISAELQHSKR